MKSSNLRTQIARHINRLQKCSDDYRKGIDVEKCLGEIQYLCDNLSAMIRLQIMVNSIQNQLKERDYDQWALDYYSDFPSFWLDNEKEITQRILENYLAEGSDDAEYIIEQAKQHFKRLFNQKDPWLEIARACDDEEYNELYDWL